MWSASLLLLRPELRPELRVPGAGRGEGRLPRPGAGGTVPSLHSSRLWPSVSRERWSLVSVALAQPLTSTGVAHPPRQGARGDRRQDAPHTREAAGRAVLILWAKVGAEEGSSASFLGWLGPGFLWGPARFRHRMGQACVLWYPEDSSPTAGGARGGLFPSAAPTNHHRGLLGACARPRTQSSVDGETQGAAELPGPSCPNAAPGAELGAGGGHQRPPSASRDGLTGRRW